MNVPCASERPTVKIIIIVLNTFFKCFFHQTMTLYTINHRDVGFNSWTNIINSILLVTYFYLLHICILHVIYLQ